jgi:hypothetical protein
VASFCQLPLTYGAKALYLFAEMQGFFFGVILGEMVGLLYERSQYGLQRCYRIFGLFVVGYVLFDAFAKTLIQITDSGNYR